MGRKSIAKFMSLSALLSGAIYIVWLQSLLLIGDYFNRAGRALSIREWILGCTLVAVLAGSIASSVQQAIVWNRRGRVSVSFAEEERLLNKAQLQTFEVAISFLIAIYLLVER